ncbi:MAG TPA: hypothetical protein VMD05_07235 [Candidatus Nanoarchaeia archaeon]|nr:hypothetical protein [Candidatus Nanoarchaeia archaeon]
MKAKNENITLWILEQDRQRNEEKLLKEMALKAQKNNAQGKNHCRKCKKNFAEPKLVQYYACPHCLNKMEEEAETGCQHWLGFLGQKDNKESVPPECVECDKVLECMLNQIHSSQNAVSQIKKWY